MNLKYRLYDDYSEGAHPRILEALSNTNMQQEAGYGEDSLCAQARELIKQKIGNLTSEVHFVSGGTQANLVVLNALLKPYEAVIAVQSGHINAREAGAIEATGHKIITIETIDGKITPTQINEVMLQHHSYQMVKPRAVYISQSTELGTFYTKQELVAIAAMCKVHQLYLYLDGARLGSALMAKGADVTLTEIAQLTDAFYIGGTKNGALLGEAIVINNPKLQEDFRYYLKQRGALLAKGRIFGVQFMELFRDDLFFTLAQHANTIATKLTAGITACGYEFLVPSTTNMLFPILPNDIIQELQKKYGFYVWLKSTATTSAIRLITSWATEEKTVKEFIHDLKNLS